MAIFILCAESKRRRRSSGVVRRATLLDYLAAVVVEHEEVGVLVARVNSGRHLRCSSFATIVHGPILLPILSPLELVTTCRPTQYRVLRGESAFSSHLKSSLKLSEKGYEQ